MQITKDFWFIYQALGAYWFYRLGTYLKNWGYLSKELPLIPDSYEDALN